MLGPASSVLTIFDSCIACVHMPALKSFSESFRLPSVRSVRTAPLQPDISSAFLQPSIDSQFVRKALLFFKNTKFRTRRSAVLCKFFLSGKYRLAGDHPPLGNPSAYTDRKFRGADAWIFIPAESIFDNAVLERMKRNDTQPPSGGKHVDHRIEGILEHLQFSLQAIRIA